MDLIVTTRVIEWRGPAPFYFAALPPDAVDAVKEIAAALTYGWGCIPCEVTLEAGTPAAAPTSPTAAPSPPAEAGLRWRTSLMPSEGGYLVPLKDAVRRPAGIGLDDDVTLTVHLPNP